MTTDYFWMSVWDHMGVPVLILFGGAIVALLQKFGTKMTKAAETKTQVANLNRESATRIQLLEELKVFVQAAVASNMTLANKFKEANGGKLTQEQITELKDSARTLVYSVLPPSLSEPDGVLLELIGGQGRLDIIINNFIDQFCYEYKDPEDRKPKLSKSQNTSKKKM